MPSVSVIVPVYNTAPFMRRSLDSLLSQKHADFRAICIDDGSTDESLAILRDYESRDSRVNVFTKKNSGVSDTRNLGLSLAKGEYVYFFDPDDWLEPDLLSENVAMADVEGSDVVMFGFREVALDGRVLSTQGGGASAAYGDRKRIADSLAGILRRNRINPVWNKLYRRSSLLKAGASFPPQRVGEDALFNIRAFSCFSRMSVNAGVYYNYLHARPSSATNSRVLEIFKHNRKLVPEIRKMFDSFEADDDGFINEVIVNMSFIAHARAARAAALGEGYSDFLAVIEGEGLNQLLGLMDSHGLRGVKHRIKNFSMRFPFLIYLYERAKVLKF